jgi:GH18 family chitinase
MEIPMYLGRALALSIAFCALTSGVLSDEATPVESQETSDPQAVEEGAITDAATGSPWVSGYYAGWYWDWYPPSAVDMTTMTHFIFGRYAPGAGTLGGSAGQLVLGAGTGHGATVEDALVAKAHASGVKALAMIGGARDGKGYVLSTAPAVRARFIKNILDRCVAKNYDGVDINWEDFLETATQRNQLIAFLRELRTAAAARPRYKAPHAPFVITFPGSWININVDLPVPAWKATVASLVDQYNLMTYGTKWHCCGWDTWLWAALDGEGLSYPTSISASIQAYVDAGVPRSRLGMGLGLYGSGYGPPVTGPRQDISGSWGGNDNVYNWADFYKKGMFSGTYHFDSAAQAGYYTYAPPRIYRGKPVSMLTTEDTRSIAAKGAWAKAGNCGGTIVWTINYGYVSSLGRNLPMEAVKAHFLGGTSPPPGSLAISDAALDEGPAGTRSAVFTVRLSAPASATVTVRYATANGTAAAGSDYTAASGTLSFAPGQTSKTVTVVVRGDAAIENDETFKVTLSGAVHSAISRSVGTATIRNDDFPALSIGDARKAEGHAGTTSAVFTVTLSSASPQTVAVNYTAGNGTATAGSDYAATAGNLTFAPGTTSRTLAVAITGDTVVEPDETLVVNLSSPVKVKIARSQGRGTILNDDHAGTPPVAGTPVAWTSAAGVSVSGSSLTKTAAIKWGNSGAVSTHHLRSGNGHVEVTAGETTTNRMFGLGNGDSTQDYADIEHALYLAAGGKVKVYEKGVLRGMLGTFVTGDKLRVAVESGVVRYRRNGNLLYTSPVAPRYPLLVDTALYSQGATLKSAVLSGSWALPAPPPPSMAVVWTAAAGVSVSGSSLTKTAVTRWGNAGAISTKALFSGNGHVEVTAGETTTNRMFGLGNLNSSHAYADIEHALQLTGGAVKVYEKGVLRGTFGNFVTGDRLRVAVESGVVRYRRNGNLLYTSRVRPKYPVRVDTALASQGATLKSAAISGSWR